MELIEARFTRRLSQWDLRLRTGISQTKISLIERGYVAPRDEEKKKLAKALGMRSEEINWPQKSDDAGPLQPTGAMSNA